MNAPPWMPLYIKDFIVDTMHLGATETGIYIRLIMHCWQHGSIPPDDRKLALIGHCGSRLWNKHKAVIITFFETSADGSMYQKRTLHELRRSEEISNKRKASALQKHTQPHSRSEEEKKESKVLDFASASPEESKEGFGYSSFDGTVSFTAAEIAQLGLKFYTLTKIYGQIRNLAESDHIEKMRPQDRKKQIINLLRKTHSKRIQNFAPDPQDQVKAAVDAEADRRKFSEQQLAARDAILNRRKISDGSS
jgi:uncharacterized protein YdaU (DUF1376 family)